MKLEADVPLLVSLFNQCFADYSTVLVAGADEPIYLPATEHQAQHQVVFAHGYYASALHEIAHWCVAGEARRKLEDYGYWYCPDGRNQQQQAEFEKVEVYPQALEMAFTLASGRRFQVSVDNLSGFQSDRHAFQAKVEAKFQSLLELGFPERASRFIAVLEKQFSTNIRQQEPSCSHWV